MAVSRHILLLILLTVFLAGCSKTTMESPTSTVSEPDPTQYLDIIAPHLEIAKKESDDAIEKYLDDIRLLISDAKPKSYALAVTVQGRRNTDSDVLDTASIELLEKEFRKIITEENLASTIEQAGENYIKEVDKIDENMFSRIRKDLSNLSKPSRLQTLEISQINENFQKVILQIQRDVQGKNDDSKMSPTAESGTAVAHFVLEAFFRDWDASPEGGLTNKIIRQLDRIGDAAVLTLRQRLTNISDSRNDYRREAIKKMLQPTTNKMNGTVLLLVIASLCVVAFVFWQPLLRLCFRKQREPSKSAISDTVIIDERFTEPIEDGTERPELDYAAQAGTHNVALMKIDSGALNGMQKAIILRHATNCSFIFL